MLVQINWKPSDRQLRQFGALSMLMLPAITLMWSSSTNWLLAATLIGFVLAVAAWFWPRLVTPLFLGLSLIALPIGWVVSELVLFILYVGIFVPMGCWFRIRGRDRLELELDRKRTSYWQTKKKPTSASSYYRQS